MSSVQNVLKDTLMSLHRKRFKTDQVQQEYTDLEGNAFI